MRAFCPLVNLCKCPTLFKKNKNGDCANRDVFFLKTLSVRMYLVQQPDPNQPKPEGAQMLAMRGEQLGVVTNWPPSLEAALQRWGTISPKAPCLTTMDTNGKPLYILTYGNSLRLLHLPHTRWLLSGGLTRTAFHVRYRNKWGPERKCFRKSI